LKRGAVGAEIEMLEASRGEELEGYAMAWPDPLVRNFGLGSVVKQEVEPPNSADTVSRLWVLELFAMYATEGQTDGRTNKSNAYCPFPTVGHIIT